MAAKAGKEPEVAAAAAASAAAGEEVPDKPKKKLPLKLILMVAGALLLLGGGATAFFMLRAKADEQRVAEPVKPVAFLEVPDVLVNLSNVGTEKTQYLKVRIVLELADQIMIPQVQALLPRVMDAFQTYLRELRPSDLEGSAGLYRLRDELTRRANVALAPGHINAVLFKEIVVQ